jgi:hypothetical protein
MVNGMVSGKKTTKKDNQERVLWGFKKMICKFCKKGLGYDFKRLGFTDNYLFTIRGVV